MMYVDVGAWSDRNYPQGAVVIGYNGKQHSRVALIWAAAEAVRRSAPLVVVYAANYPGMTVEPGPGLLRREPGALAAAEEVTARGVTEALESHPGLMVAGATEVTSPSQALVEASAGAELVVIGSRGLGQLAGTLLGSVGFAVAARAECPVVVVKDESLDRAVGPGHSVLVGTDGSPAAEAAVRFAAGRAAGASAALQIVTSTGGRQVQDVDEQELHASAVRTAETAAALVREIHPGVEVTTLVEDCPAEVTLVARSVDAGLVVVGTRGRGAFEGMLLGSVSHAVLHSARCVVAVVDEGQA